MAAPTVAKQSLEMTRQAELQEELRRSEQDFAEGDFIEVTVEDLDRSLAAGEWPWASEFSE